MQNARTKTIFMFFGFVANRYSSSSIQAATGRRFSATKEFACGEFFLLNVLYRIRPTTTIAAAFDGAFIHSYPVHLCCFLGAFNLDRLRFLEADQKWSRAGNNHIFASRSPIIPFQLL